MPSRCVSSASNRSVCHSSSSSVRPLNVLPSIAQPPVSSSRAPRWRLDSRPRRRPWPHSAASTTRSSVCTGLTFSQPDPRRPAAYGASSAFTTTPSCPAASAASNSRAGRVGVLRDRARDAQLRRDDRVERLAAARERLVEQVLAVDVQHVEEQRGERRGPRTARAEARGGDLERLGPPVGAQRDRLAVEHDRPHGQRARGGDHLGQPRRHVVERAREQRHVVAVAMDLQPRAVELPVDRGRPGPGERGRDVGRGAGEHRRQRPPDLEPDRRQAGAPVAQRDRRDGGEVAVQRQRPPQLAPGQPGRPRRGVGHDARERALAEVAQQQPHQEVLLRRARPRQQRLHGRARAPSPIPGRASRRSRRARARAPRPSASPPRRVPAARAAARSRRRSGAA